MGIQLIIIQEYIDTIIQIKTISARPSAWPSDAVQLKAPVELSILAPEGIFVAEWPRVSSSASEALTVKLRILHSFTFLLR